MNEDEQLQEMAKDLCHTYACEIRKSGIPCNHRCRAHIYATRAIAKGYRKVERGEWISVEDGLPESGVHCLVACTVKRIDGTHGQYVCVGYYAEKFKNLAYGVDDDCVSEYNEEDDEYYIVEGWYEVIKNWDDYGFVAIDDWVTHWMPLPEPPSGADMRGER